jgi:thiamine-phosphate pyrophosphorylase
LQKKVCRKNQANLSRAVKKSIHNMLIVVSDAVMLKNEAALINALFEEGLEIFHLRKPGAAASEWQQLLEKINPEHWNKIALHAHHQLANMFGMNRLHYTEARRKSSTGEEWVTLKENGCHLSTSTHQLEEADKLSGSFDYAFLGPVFNSISKQGYTSMISKDRKLPVTNTKLIAIGGIKENNMLNALQMGFKGVALLGTIWQSNDPVYSFQEIKKTWNSIAL